MEYYNIILFVLIFLIILVSFYLIISNFGFKTTDDLNKYQSNNDLQTTLSLLKLEFDLIKNEINKSNPTNLTNSTNSTSPVQEIVIEQDNPNPTVNNYTEPNPTTNLINKPPPVIYDPIANYDIAKLTDPLVDPRGRTSADQIPTPQVAMQFNIPTQGVLDRYHRVGLLIGIESNVRKEKNDKIELPYSTSEKMNSSNLSSYSDNFDTNSTSGFVTGSDFVWDGPSKTNINRRKKKFIKMETESSNSQSKSIPYKGVDIKENFDSDSDSDSYEYFGNTDNSITNVYNVYPNNNDNNILELIGKKITDNWYKYFTSITMGNKIIKVVVHNKNRKELYSGDIIYIPEIKRSYRVNIDPMDMVEYNPYLF